LLPHDIIEVEVVDDDLIVVAHPYLEEEAFSFTLNPKSVLPGLAEQAQNAGLPVAQYAASKIRSAKDEQHREDQRLNALPQTFYHAAPSFPQDQSLWVTRNRIFVVFPIIIVALFAAMVYYGHDRGRGRIPPPNHHTQASCPPHKQS
jgi:hypothetical protein